MTASGTPEQDQGPAERPNPDSFSNEELTRELHGAGLLEGVIRDDDDMEAEDDEADVTASVDPGPGFTGASRTALPSIPGDEQDDA